MGVAVERFSEEALIRAYFESRDAAGDGPGVLVDVGAYFGGGLKPYLSMGWEVHAFEPDPVKHEKLRTLGDWMSFRLWTCALGSVARSGVPFYVSSESHGISSMLAFRDTHVEAHAVDVRRLDDVLAEAGVTRVDYLKVDAEGHDLDVLLGHDWDRWRPRVVMAEFEDAKTIKLGYGIDDLGGFFLGHGYDVWLSEWKPIERYGVEHTWRSLRRYPAPLADNDAWGNFIAVDSGDAEAFGAVASRWMD